MSEWVPQPDEDEPELADRLAGERPVPGAEFRGSSEATRAFWLRQAQVLGSSAVRLGVSWALVAPVTLPAGFKASDPNDPRYHWTALDAAVRDASANHQSITISIAHAPRW